MASKARKDRQKRALERFVILKRNANFPHTNIKRFKSDAEYDGYLFRKRREEWALVHA